MSNSTTPPKDVSWRHLADAIKIATEVHNGQYDRGGKPYILHPLHIMNQLLFDPELACIAVLHDVVEDSDNWTIGKMAMQFPDRICTALELLTHNKGDDYLGVYIPKIATNYDAIRVKRKDLEHNSDITRLKGVTDKDLARMKKYHTAFIMLGKARHSFIRQ